MDTTAGYLLTLVHLLLDMQFTHCEVCQGLISLHELSPGEPPTGEPPPRESPPGELPTGELLLGEPPSGEPPPRESPPGGVHSDSVPRKKRSLTGHMTVILEQ